MREQEARIIKEECEYALSNAFPELEKALDNLKTLTKNDFSELKSLRKPPQAIKNLLEIVCIFMNIEPLKEKSEFGDIILDYW